MTSLLAVANAYGWVPKNLRQGLGARRHPAGTNAPTSGNLSLSTFSGQAPTFQQGNMNTTTITATGIIGGRGAPIPGTTSYAVAEDSCIKIVTAGGSVSVLAGLAGTPGQVNGTGSAARFINPGALAVNPTGTLIAVADTPYNGQPGVIYAIRIITYPGGVVTTLCGNSNNTAGQIDGTGSGAGIGSIRSMAFRNATSIVAVDWTTIRIITSATWSANTGVVVTVAGISFIGPPADGTGTAARFRNSAITVTVMSPTMVAIHENYTVRIITSSNWAVNTGVVVTVAGVDSFASQADGTGASARFATIRALVYIPSTGALIATDSAGSPAPYNLRRITSATWAVNTGVVTTLGPTGGSSYGQVLSLTNENLVWTGPNAIHIIS